MGKNAFSPRGTRPSLALCRYKDAATPSLLSCASRADLPKNDSVTQAIRTVFSCSVDKSVDKWGKNGHKSRFFCDIL